MFTPLHVRHPPTYTHQRTKVAFSCVYTKIFLRCQKHLLILLRVLIYFLHFHYLTSQQDTRISIISSVGVILFSLSQPSLSALEVFCL